MKYLDYHECAPYCLGKLPEDFRRQIENDLVSRTGTARISGIPERFTKRMFWEDHALWVTRVGSALYDVGVIGTIEWQWVKAYANCYYALYERWNGRKEPVTHAFMAWPVKPKWWQFRLRYWYEMTKRYGRGVIEFEHDPFVEVRAEIEAVEKLTAKWAIPPREEMVQ